MYNLKNNELKFIIIMIIAMITWGYSWTSAKILGPYGDINVKLVLRFLLAAVTLAPILIWYKIDFYINKSGIKFILINALALCSYNYFYFKSTHLGLAGVGGVLVTTLNPLLTSTITFLFFNKSFSKKDVIGLIIGFVGGGIIMRLWEMNYTLMLKSGNIYFILASLSWVTVTINSQNSNKSIHFLTYSFWRFICSFLISFIFCDWKILIETFQYGSKFWINILILSIIVMSFANTIYFYASSKLGAVKASSFIFVVPLTALIFSRLLLSEQILISTLIGGMFSIAAVYIINKK